MERVAAAGKYVLYKQNHFVGLRVLPDRTCLLASSHRRHEHTAIRLCDLQLELYESAFRLVPDSELNCHAQAPFMLGVSAANTLRSASSSRRPQTHGLGDRDVLAGSAASFDDTWQFLDNPFAARKTLRDVLDLPGCKEAGAVSSYSPASRSVLPSGLGCRSASSSRGARASGKMKLQKVLVATSCSSCLFMFGRRRLAVQVWRLRSRLRVSLSHRAELCIDRSAPEVIFPAKTESCPRLVNMQQSAFPKLA